MCHKITIIITVYNCEQYVENCVKSVANQSSTRYALLILDDGSTDHSLEICRQCVDMIPNAQVISLPHCGVAATRNYGLSQVNTEYVMFLDGDDELKSDTVERLLAEKRDTQTFDLTVFPLLYVLPAGQTYEVSATAKQYRTREELLDNFTAVWNSGLLYSVCNKVFRNSLLIEHEIKFSDMDFGEDFAFCRDYLRHCESLAMTQSGQYRYTCHTVGSLSTIYRSNLFQIRVDEHLAMKQYLETMGCMLSEAEEFLARRHLERIVGCVENECSPLNDVKIGEKLKHIRSMIWDENTAWSVERAELTSLRMKILVTPIQFRLPVIMLFFGSVMSFCRNKLPRLFTWLKMNR